MRRIWPTVLLSWLLGTAAGVAAERVNLIKVEGPIGPATAGFISRAIDQAAENQSQCLVIQLDTPGRPARLHQDHRAEIPRLARAHRRVRRAGGRDRDQRGLLHHAGGRPRGDGARHQHRRRAPGGDRRQSRRRRGKTRRHDEAEAGELRRQLHRNHRRPTQPQRRMGQVLRQGKRLDLRREGARS